LRIELDASLASDFERSERRWLGKEQKLVRERREGRFVVEKLEKVLQTVVVGCKKREKERRKKREIVLESVGSKGSKLLVDDLHTGCSSK